MATGNKVPFSLLQRPHKGTLSFYHHLGLRRSVKQVWNTATLRFYGCESAKGTPLPEAYSDIEDDPHQMGGDFMLDKDSKLVFIYRSKRPNDRPSVDEVLEIVKHHTL